MMTVMMIVVVVMMAMLTVTMVVGADDTIAAMAITIMPIIAMVKGRFMICWFCSL